MSLLYPRLSPLLKVGTRNEDASGNPVVFPLNKNLATLFYVLDTALEDTYLNSARENSKKNLYDINNQLLQAKYRSYSGIINEYLNSVSFLLDDIENNNTNRNIVINLLKKINNVFYFKGTLDLYKVIILEAFLQIDNLFIETLFYDVRQDGRAVTDINDQIFTNIPADQCLTYKEIFILQLENIRQELADEGLDLGEVINNRAEGNSSLFFDIVLTELYNENLLAENNIILLKVWEKIKKVIDEGYLITSYYRIRLTNAQTEQSTRLIDNVVNLVNPIDKVYIGTVTEVVFALVLNYRYHLGIDFKHEIDFKLNYHYHLDFEAITNIHDLILIKGNIIPINRKTIFPVEYDSNNEYIKFDGSVKINDTSSWFIKSAIGGHVTLPS